MFESKNPFRNPDSLVDAVRDVLSGKPNQTQENVKKQTEAMDPVDPKALKGKHKDRKDKDIDNDGDVDSSDKYLHKRRQAVSKAMKEEVKVDEAKFSPKEIKMAIGIASDKRYKGGNMTGAANAIEKIKPGLSDHPQVRAVLRRQNEEVELDEADIISKYQREVSKLEAKKNKTPDEIDRLKKIKQKLRKIYEETDDNPANTQHLCAKNVVHENWGEGVCIPTMHADPDAEGNVEWYDIMFEHGIETRVSIEELKVTKAESHMHKKKVKNEEKDDVEGETETDIEKAKKKEKKMDGKKDDIDLEPEMDDNKMVAEKEMTDDQMKKREEIVKSMKDKMPEFKKKYGDRAKDVMYATATKMAMKT